MFGKTPAVPGRGLGETGVLILHTLTPFSLHPGDGFNSLLQIVLRSLNRQPSCVQ